MVLQEEDHGGRIWRRHRDVDAADRPDAAAFRYYRNPLLDDEDSGPGLKIQVPPGDHGFLQTVTETLDALWATPTGQRLIDELVASGRDILISKTPNFVSNTERPPGVGLAHELIHAYWSVRGEQLGWTVDTDTTVLFEHKCVGIGHWDSRLGPRMCENQIRDEWFGNTARLFNMSDRVNRSRPSRRAFYSAPD